jgi:ADP-ribose pyrophosphatase YjhB (NUDIX family)
MELDEGTLAHEANDPDPPISAAGGVVYRWTASRQIEVLLIKKQGGFWTLPKGRVKVGEDDHQAVVREVAEETGLAGHVERMIQQVVYTIQKAGRPRRKTVTYYLVRAGAGKPRPDARERIIHVRWFLIDVALKRVRRKRIRDIVRAAQDMLDTQMSNP